MGNRTSIQHWLLAATGTLFASCATPLDLEAPAEAASTEGAIQVSSLVHSPIAHRERATRSGAPSAALALSLAYPTLPEPKAASRPPEPQPRLEPKPRVARGDADTLKVRTTAYCRDEDDHFTFGSMSAIGKPLRLGAVRSAAADWSRYPAGTRFRIVGDESAVYEIDDYGSALVGSDTIDLYQPDEFAMEDWGVRHVDIELLRWGSRSRSLKVLRGRAGTPHIDTMIRGLERGAGKRGHDDGS